MGVKELARRNWSDRELIDGAQLPNAFCPWRLPPLADFTDVLGGRPKSTPVLERYWRPRDDAPAAVAIAR